MNCNTANCQIDRDHYHLLSDAEYESEVQAEIEAHITRVEQDAINYPDHESY